MKIKDILAKCDHTWLKQTATWDEIKAVCDDGIRFGCASVCIPACYTKQAQEYVNGKIAICTVIGFPNGYDTTAAKCFMAEDAVGADEIDMVVNLGWVKDHKWQEITEEIKAVKEVCGNKILKVIIETCLLTDSEKATLCTCVTAGGADYIKTSTGFSTGGATASDVVLLSKLVGDCVKVKAAGGIHSIEDAFTFIDCGADRLGTSKLVRIVKDMGIDVNDDVKKHIPNYYNT